MFRLYLFTVRYISAIKRIPRAVWGADAKEQSLKKHKKLPKEAGKTPVPRCSQSKPLEGSRQQAESGVRSEENTLLAPGRVRAGQRGCTVSSTLGLQSFHQGFRASAGTPRPITASITMAAGDGRSGHPSLGLKHGSLFHL